MGNAKGFAAAFFSIVNQAKWTRESFLQLSQQLVDEELLEMD